MSATYQVSVFPTIHFSDYVECIKIYQFLNDSPIRLHPEGCFNMIFQLEEGFLHNTPSTTNWEKRPQYFIGGLHNQSYWIKPPKANCQLLSIQFKVNGAKYFIPDHLHHFKNKTVDMEDAYSSKQLSILKKIDVSTNSLPLLEAFLKSIFQEKTLSPIDEAVHLIKQHQGYISMRQVAQSIKISSAQFRKRFNQEVGISPKEYNKINRFNVVLQYLKQHPTIKLTDLAYQFDYFDQSHFIRDFQSITGTTPKKFAW